MVINPVSEENGILQVVDSSAYHYHEALEFLNISWTREFELKYLKLPESWKWNITLNEKKLILEGAIFHGTMIMVVEGYTE